MNDLVRFIDALGNVHISSVQFDLILANWIHFVLVTHDDNTLDAFGYMVAIESAKGARP